MRRFGGDYVNVVLHGTSFDQASSHAKHLCDTHGYTFVPPFDDPDVIAGQGTVARELLEQNPNHRRGPEGRGQVEPDTMPPGPVAPTYSRWHT